MKQKIALVFTLVVLTTSAFAQMDNNSGMRKKPALFGIHFNAVDFKTPITLKDRSSSRIFASPKDMDFGFSLSYWKGLNSIVDFSTKITALLHDYAGDRNQAYNNTEIGIELEPTLNFRPFRDNNIFNPFLTLGIGGGYYSDDFGAYAPAGIGLQFNFKSVTYLMLQGQYRFSLTEDVVKDNLFYSIGVLQNIGRERTMVVAPPPPPVVLDRDGDGVLDADDKCPDTPGLASLQGCPDRDGDGIADGDDKCPDVAGIAKYQGCPIPDTDGDGVNDEEDKCPNRPGPASNMGCPVIAKEVIDKINFAAKNVFFATGSYKLLPKSFKSLNDVANLMKADESLMVDIDGHTDEVGTNESNQVLSDNRAGSVKEYLMKQGVDASRLKSSGFGEDKPVADNKTAAGRAKNRRTEMTVRNY